MANVDVAALPVGRRTPRGERRWYFVHAPEGEELLLCDEVRKVVPLDVLEDAFVTCKERWRKVDGVWRLFSVPMYSGYFFAVTKDVIALDKELSKLPFPVHIARLDGRHYAPLSVSVQERLESMLDEDRVLRNSTAVIVDGVLTVQDGPLVGQEDQIRKVDRHRRCCIVDIADGPGGSFVETLPLHVPFKG